MSYYLDDLDKVNALPVGSIIVVGEQSINTVKADPAPLQKGYTGEWLGCGFEHEIDMAELRDESWPVMVLHEGLYPDPPQSDLDDLLELLAGIRG